MLARSVKRPTASRHREMGGTYRFPALNGLDPVIRSRTSQIHAAFQTKGGRVTTGFRSVLPYAGNDRFALVAQVEERKPPIGQTRNAPHARFRWQRRLGCPRANPDRN